jgi:hypothetical protein
MSAPIDLLDLVRATSRAVDAAVGDFLGERVALPRLSWALRPHTWWHLVGSVSVLITRTSRTFLGCWRSGRPCWAAPGRAGHAGYGALPPDRPFTHLPMSVRGSYSMATRPVGCSTTSKCRFPSVSTVTSKVIRSPSTPVSDK